MALTLMRQIAVLFLMMGGGWLLVKLKLLRGEDSRALSVVLIYLVQPCVILRAFQIEFTDTVRRGFLVALAAAVLANGAQVAIGVALRRVAKLSAVEQASITFSNAGNLVIPLVTAMLGEEWVIYASAFMCVQLVLIWTFGASLIRGQRGVQLRRIFTNCNLIAVVVGLVMLVTGLRLPSLIGSTMEGLSATIGPVSMVMIGMLFAGTDLKKAFGSWRLWGVCLLKMLLSPALVLGLLYLTRLWTLAKDGHTVLFISFLAVMTPTASMVTQLAQLHNNQPEVASTINVLTTVMCIATMPMMTWLFNALIG